MTNGTTQGLFILLAIVIFGIFVLISYMLYQDKMKTGLATIMCDAITITSKNTGFELSDKDCTYTFPSDENNEIPTGLQYYKIRDSNEQRNESEVWVLIEHEQDNPNNVRIIDSGDRDGFSLETFGQDLDGIISFPDKIENWNITHIDKKSFEQAKFSEIMKLPDELIILDDYSLKQSVFTGEARFPENLEIIGIQALRDSRFTGGLDTLPNIKEIRENALKESEFADNDLTELGKNSDELVLKEGSLGKYSPQGTLKLPDSLTELGSISGYGGAGGGSNGQGSSGGGSGGSNGSGDGSGSSDGGSGQNGFGGFDSSGITDIDFTNVKNLKIIGDNIFKDTEIIGDLKIPETVEAIGNGAFENVRLKGILYLPDSVKYVGDRAFYESEFINENWKLPKNIEYIGDNAFYNSKMTGDFYAEESNKLKYIGDYSFYNSYKNLNSSDNWGILDNVGKKTRVSFAKYAKTQHLYLPDTIEYIGDYSFYNSEFTGDFTIPEKTKYIGDSAFRSSFGEYEIEKHLIRTSGSATRFSHNYKENSQSNFTFNQNIEYIGERAFLGSHFKYNPEIIPRKLHTIGFNAFGNSFSTKITSYEEIRNFGITSPIYYYSPTTKKYNKENIKIGKFLTNYSMDNIEIVD